MDRCEDKFDFIFAGPPYPSKRIPDLPLYVFRNELLQSDGWFVLEHNPNHDFKDHPKLDQVRNYGTTIFSIFVNSSKALK